MSDVKLGQLIQGEAHRDAIHIAVVMVAGELLYPGQRVAVVDGEAHGVREALGRLRVQSVLLIHSCNKTCRMARSSGSVFTPAPACGMNGAIRRLKKPLFRVAVPEFWHRWSALTGKPVSGDDYDPYSCSC